MRALGLATVLLGWVPMGVGCAAGVATAQAPAPARPAPAAPADVSPVPALAGIRLEREELAPLRAAEGQLAGFVSLAGVAALAASSDTAEVTNLAREPASLPDRGETAILVRGGSSRSGASGAVTRVRVVLTPTALSSLFRWALAAAAGGAS